MTGPRGWGEAWRPQEGTEPPDRPAATGPAPGLSLSELVDRVVLGIRSAPRVMWTFGALVVVVVGVLEGVLGSVLGLPRLLDRLADGPWSTVDRSGEIAALVGQAVVSTLGWVVTTIATALLTSFVAVALAVVDAGARPTVRGVWRAVRPRLAAAVALALVLVVTLVVLAGIVAATLALTLTAHDGAGTVLGAALLALVLAGAAAFWVVPAVVMAVPEVAVVPSPPSPSPRTGPGAALARSWGLVRGQRWRLVGVWLLTTIVLSIAHGAIAAPFGWLATIVVGGDPLATWHPAAAASAISVAGATVAAAVTAPIGSLVLAAVHADLSRARSS